MFIIIDVSDCSELFANRPGGEWIPPESRPTFIHWDGDAAETELLRLQKKHPARDFILFQAIQNAVPIFGTDHFKTLPLTE